MLNNLLYLVKSLCFFLLTVGLVPFIAPRALLAQAETEPPSTLSGDWNGLRSGLENRGISTELVYRFLPMGNMRGGVETGTVWMDNLDVSVTVDLEKALHWSGSTLYVYGLSNRGELLTPKVGDIQVVSNIETTTRTQLYEIWLEKNYLNGALSFLVGKYDLNLEFDVVNPGGVFLHSSFGIAVDYSLTGYAGPSIFPWTAWAGRAAWWISDRLKVQTMLADASPNYSGIPSSAFGKDGYLAAAEVWFVHLPGEHYVRNGRFSRKSGTFSRNAGRASVGEPQNRLVAGIWSYSSPFPHVETGLAGAKFANAGGYISAQHYLFTSDSGDFIAAFLRAGFANQRFNRFKSSFTGGISGAMSLAGKPFEYGVAFSHARNSDMWMDANSTGFQRPLVAETALEATVTFSPIPGIILQPDLQYVIHPGTDRSIANAWVAGLQLKLVL